jgi:hypothetical protein
LDQLGQQVVPNNLQQALNASAHPEETHDWLHQVVAEALRDSLNEIEIEYRKLRNEGV